MTCLSRFRGPVAALLVLLLAAGTSSAQWTPFLGPNLPPTPPANIPNPPQPQNRRRRSRPLRRAAADSAAGPSGAQGDDACERAAALQPEPFRALCRRGQPVTRSLHWRIFTERQGTAEPLALVSESQEAAPTFSLAPGKYVVHVAYGLASSRSA